MDKNMTLRDLLKKTMPMSVLMTIGNFNTNQTIYSCVYDYEIDDEYKSWEVIDIEVSDSCLYIRIKEVN